MTSTTMRIGIIGTGMMATGLGTCFARAGFSLTIGSRDSVRAERLASILRETATRAGNAGSVMVGAESIQEVLETCGVIVLAVPTRIRDRNEQVDGVVHFLRTYGEIIRGKKKILVDITYYGRGNFGRPTPPRPFRSAISYHASEFNDFSEQQTPGTYWVCGFKSVMWTSMRDGKKQGIEIAGHSEAREVLAEIIRKTGFTPLDCGGIEEAGSAEPGGPLRKPHPGASV